MSERVYCKDCRFYRRGESSMGLEFHDAKWAAECERKGIRSCLTSIGNVGIKSCNHFTCFSSKTHYDPATGKTVETLKRIAGFPQKNRDGHCPDYERKLWKFWKRPNAQ